jgi:hypothetical protein
MPDIMLDSGWQFHCARCDRPISGALEKLSLPSHLVRLVAGWPAVPAGFFVPPQESPLPGLEAFSGGWLVASDSLRDISSVEHSSPDLSCASGHPLGTIVVDEDHVGGACLSVEQVVRRPAPADAVRYSVLTFAPDSPLTDVADFVRWLCVAVDLPLRRLPAPARVSDSLDEVLDTWRTRAREPAVIVWRRWDRKLDESVPASARTAFTTLVNAFKRHKPFLTLFWTY